MPRDEILLGGLLLSDLEPGVSDEGRPYWEFLVRPDVDGSRANHHRVSTRQITCQELLRTSLRLHRGVILEPVSDSEFGAAIRWLHDHQHDSKTGDEK